MRITIVRDIPVQRPLILRLYRRARPVWWGFLILLIGAAFIALATTITILVLAVFFWNIVGETFVLQLAIGGGLLTIALSLVALMCHIQHEYLIRRMAQCDHTHPHGTIEFKPIDAWRR